MYHKNKIHSKARKTIVNRFITTLPFYYYSSDPNEVQVFKCFLTLSYYLVTQHSQNGKKIMNNLIVPQKVLFPRRAIVYLYHCRQLWKYHWLTPPAFYRRDSYSKMQAYVDSCGDITDSHCLRFTEWTVTLKCRHTLQAELHSKLYNCLCKNKCTPPLAVNRFRKVCFKTW
jgi:hypothetical protein